MAVSAEYRYSQEMSRETAFRTIGRKLSLTALMTDAVCWVYMIIWICYFCNYLRLPVYQPGQMRPWDDFIFWRLGVPVGLLAMLPHACMTLVWYTSPIPFGAFLAMAIVVVVWSGVSIGYLIADWISCSDRLWCTCLTSYTFNLGVIVIVPCSAPHDGVTGTFIAHFFLQLTLVIYASLGFSSLGFYYHFSYSHQVKAEHNANSSRSALIASEFQDAPLGRGKAIYV